MSSIKKNEEAVHLILPRKVDVFNTEEKYLVI